MAIISKFSTFLSLLIFSRARITPSLKTWNKQGTFFIFLHLWNEEMILNTTQLCFSLLDIQKFKPHSNQSNGPKNLTNKTFPKSLIIISRRKGECPGKK